MRLRAPREVDFEHFLMSANARLTEGQTKGRLGFPDERFRVLFIHDLVGLRVAFYRIVYGESALAPLWGRDPDHTFIFSQMSGRVADAMMALVDPERVSVEWARDHADPCPYYPVRSKVYCSKSEPISGVQPTLPPPNPTG